MQPKVAFFVSSAVSFLSAALTSAEKALTLEFLQYYAHDNEDQAYYC